MRLFILLVLFVQSFSVGATEKICDLDVVVYENVKDWISTHPTGFSSQSAAEAEAKEYSLEICRTKYRECRVIDFTNCDTFLSSSQIWHHCEAMYVGKRVKDLSKKERRRLRCRKLHKCMENILMLPSISENHIKLIEVGLEKNKCHKN